ncbi:protein-L-isoaspartate(D-aspartate) O-methyltransferase [candidate division KSB1 bacterium]
MFPRRAVRPCLVLFVFLLTPSAPADEINQDFNRQRLRMVDRQIASRGVGDSLVLAAMRTVPRHLFVPEKYRGLAYADSPLPIGSGQTISQPYMVAWMSELLDVGPGDRVLEVGTGSGYQAAVLAHMGVEVFTIEIVSALIGPARKILDDLGYGNVRFRLGDGYLGWTEQAPFDGIIVTCAPDHIPDPLKRQLADGGRMIIPVGPQGKYQTLMRLVRDGDDYREDFLGGVAFVPLTRKVR